MQRPAGQFAVQPIHRRQQRRRECETSSGSKSRTPPVPRVSIRMRRGTRPIEVRSRALHSIPQSTTSAEQPHTVSLQRLHTRTIAPRGPPPGHEQFDRKMQQEFSPMPSDQDYRNRATGCNAQSRLFASESVPSRQHLATNHSTPRQPEGCRTAQAPLRYHNLSESTLIPRRQVIAARTAIPGDEAGTFFLQTQKQRVPTQFSRNPGHEPTSNAAQLRRRMPKVLAKAILTLRALGERQDSLRRSIVCSDG